MILMKTYRAVFSILADQGRVKEEWTICESPPITPDSDTALSSWKVARVIERSSNQMYLETPELKVGQNWLK